MARPRRAGKHVLPKDLQADSDAAEARRKDEEHDEEDDEKVETGGLKPIGRFHTRGMRWLGGSDHYCIAGSIYRGGFSREFWGAKDGRVFVRFHYSTKRRYQEAYEIKGITVSNLTARNVDNDFGVDEVSGLPECSCSCIWNAFIEWVEETAESLDICRSQR